MKKGIVLICLLGTLFSGCETAQQVIESVNTAYGNGALGGVGGVSNADIVNGLKQALEIGTQKSTTQLSSVDGFFKNAAIKILLPEEAKKIENTLRNAGMGHLVDKAILSMNRAAEEASKGAGSIFINAVKQMTITDATNILKGGDFAATNYFKAKTTPALAASFEPVIDKALKKVNATKYWGDVISVYNRFSSTKINTDLSAFVTQKAMDGIFFQVGLEEQRIRREPVARTTELLKKVFGSSLARGG